MWPQTWSLYKYTFFVLPFLSLVIFVCLNFGILWRLLRHIMHSIALVCVSIWIAFVTFMPYMVIIKLNCIMINGIVFVYFFCCCCLFGMCVCQERISSVFRKNRAMNLLYEKKNRHINLFTTTHRFFFSYHLFQFHSSDESQRHE